MDIKYLLSLNEIEFYEYKTFEASGEHYVVDEFNQHKFEKSELTLELELHKIKQARENLTNANYDFYMVKKEYAEVKRAHEIFNTSQTRLNLTLVGKKFGWCKTRFETLSRLNK